jgi:regulation of enolase protein 1 (concanavalin A-like superfamily)
MHYVYTQASGDFRLTVRVVTMQGVDTSSTAGLMVRSSLEPGSPTFHYSLMPPREGSMTGTSCERQTAGATPECGAELCSADLPVYLRIVRESGSFSAAYSIDGTTWTPSSYTRTVQLADPVSVGFFVQSYRADALETVTFDHVELTTEG